MGLDLHELVAETERERSGFLVWLRSIIGVLPRDLDGARALVDYPRTGLDGVFAILDKNANRLSIDSRGRADRERVGRELTCSIDKIAGLEGERAVLERNVDAVVYDAYGLSAAQRQRIASEYE
jgi:hypothetical protein